MLLLQLLLLLLLQLLLLSLIPPRCVYELLLNQNDSAQTNNSSRLQRSSLVMISPKLTLPKARLYNYLNVLETTLQLFIDLSAAHVCFSASEAPSQQLLGAPSCQHRP